MTHLERTIKLKKLVFLVFLVFTSLILSACSFTNETSLPILSLNDRRSEILTEIKSFSNIYSRSNVVDTLSKIGREFDNHKVELDDELAMIFEEYTNIQQAYLNLSEGISIDSSREDMIDLYIALINAYEGSGQWNLDTLIEETLEELKYGGWVFDDSRIEFTKQFTDFENQKSTTILNRRSLSDSMVSGREYYYYTEYKEGKLYVGFKDVITEIKTDNYEISFIKEGMVLTNLIDNITNVFIFDENSQVQIRDNARKAYEAIASVINQFNNPRSVVILRAYVRGDVVNIYVSARNSFGAERLNYYSVTKLGSNYTLRESTSFSINNIDLDELNSKLKTFVDR